MSAPAQEPGSPPLLVGDWLLVFKDGNHPPAGRGGAPWSAEQSGDDWRLWRSEVSPGWRGTPALRLETPEWSVWLVGELYGTHQPAAVVFNVLSGCAPAGALNGHFHLLARHRTTNEWHVWTNRHATVHAYLADNGTTTALGTYLPAVAAAAGCRVLDWEGLAGFFGCGFFAADRTHFKGARILRPATHYRLDGEGHLLSEKRYWEWHHAPDRGRSYEATLEEFAALFTTVMRDLTAEGRIAVPISGGLDSRSTVATMAHGGSGRLWAYSYGYAADSVETDIAARVAAARDLPFEAYTIRPYLFERLPWVLAAIEGFEDMTQCRQASAIDAIAGRADFLIAAHLGDLYLDDMGLASTAPGSMSREALTAVALKKVRKGGSEWLLEHLCRPRLGTGGPESAIRSQVESEIGRLNGIAEPDFRIKAYKVDQWCARWTTVALRMYQAGVFPRLPFYDTRLADFFLTVPAAHVAGRRLQIDYLRRHAPDLARIPWQATGRDLFHDGREPVWSFARRGFRKVRRRVSGRRVLERNWEVQFAGPGGRAGLDHWLLRPGLALHEFVPVHSVRELLNVFRKDPYTDKRSYTVAMLLTFSAWLELQAGGGLS